MDIITALPDLPQLQITMRLSSTQTTRGGFFLLHGNETGLSCVLTIILFSVNSCKERVCQYDKIRVLMM